MRPLFTFVLALLLSVAVARGEDFQIKLVRPDKVGSKHRVTMEASEANAMTVTFAGQAQPARSTKAAYKLEAEVEVLEVGTKGGATKMQLTIASLTQVTDAGDKALANKGDVVIAKVSGKSTVFESKDGVKVSPAAAKALGMMMSMDNEDTPDMEEIFGTKERKKVGDTWPINSEMAAKQFKAMGLEIEPSKIKGQGKVLSEKTESGVACLEIQLETTLTEVPVPGGKLPPGATLKSSSLTMTGTVLLPKDLSLREMGNAMNMMTKAQMTAAIPNVGEVESSMEQSRTRTVKATPIK